MTSYRSLFSIAANTHNVPSHDAILLTSDSINAGIGASFSAEVAFYSESTARGANGKPMVKGAAGAAAPDNPSITGPSQILRGSMGNSENPQYFYPIQIKSTLGFTGANLYGLRT